MISMLKILFKVKSHTVAVFRDVEEHIKSDRLEPSKYSISRFYYLINIIFNNNLLFSTVIRDYILMTRFLARENAWFV